VGDAKTLKKFRTGSVHYILCQYQVKAPPADPQFHGYKGIYGILDEDNDDAKELSKVIVGAAGGEENCTVAMHQTTINHILYIHKNGWDKYVEKMKTGLKLV